MENLFVFLATSLGLRVYPPKFRRYVIGRTGCTTLLHPQDISLHLTRTKDGDQMYFNEYASDGVTYGLICVQMKNRYTPGEAEAILVQYINRVRKPMQIGVNFSMETEVKGRMVSLTDYWQDEAGMDWKIRGYTNGQILALLYVRNINDTSVKNHDAFLNGFQFSAAK